MDGGLSTSSYLAEYKSDHDVVFNVTFVSDPSRASVSGRGLWKIEVFVSGSADLRFPMIAPTIAAIESKCIIKIIGNLLVEIHPKICPKNLNLQF